MAMLLLGTLCVHAQEMALPTSVQYPLFLKILTFDRNLKTQRKDGINIGILYQGNFRLSVDVQDEILALADDSAYQTIDGLPVHCIPVDLDRITLDDAHFPSEVNVLYIAPLRAIDVREIAQFSQKKHLPLLTGVSAYVEEGVAVGLDTKQDRPLILVNLQAAKEEGCDFSSQLLKLSKIIVGNQ